MFWVSILFFAYFLMLFLFSLVSHPVYYCGFLVVNVLICSFIGYLILGFGWYSLIFCLIYIGGVYILFVFVSVYRPNKNYITYYNLSFSLLFLLIFVMLIIGYLFTYNIVPAEFSSFLCTINEGKFYVVMCLMLLFGFVILRLVMSIKFNYYR